LIVFQNKIGYANLGNEYRKGVAMLTAITKWITLKRDRRAVTAMEYGIIAALIAVVVVAAVTLVGTNLTATFTTVAGSV
jgi:pilus assembly protein Flp/PilA